MVWAICYTIAENNTQGWFKIGSRRGRLVICSAFVQQMMGLIPEMNKGGVSMFNKLINAFKYKKYANPPENIKRTENDRGSVAGSGDDKGLGINLANYESNLQEFVPHFNSGFVEEITGYSQEEFERGLVTWDKLVHPEDMPIFYQEDQRLKNKTGYVFNIEYRIIRKNGEIRWVKDIGRG